MFKEGVDGNRRMSSTLEATLQPSLLDFVMQKLQKLEANLANVVMMNNTQEGSRKFYNIYLCLLKGKVRIKKR